jgi:uncharacterized damage-inducible protein DinB
MLTGPRCQSAGLLQKEESARPVTIAQGAQAVAKPLLKAHTQLGSAAVQIFAANDRMNQRLIEHLDPAAWKSKPPAISPTNVRSIAAIFTHMHNVRTKWIRLTAPHLKIPPQLNRAHCTPSQARAALAESAARCTEMLAEALGDSGQISSRIQTFHRDGWAPAWEVGPEMLCYMLAHEAHHRGQVCMLAHQLGFPFTHAVADGIWNWERLWKECGYPAIGSRSTTELPAKRKGLSSLQLKK